MRFRKRVKVFPGFYLNFSSSGMSSTIGMRGASINFSKRGTYLNTTVPGLGLHFSHKLGGGTSSHEGLLIPPVSHNESISRPLKGEIRSADVSELTSASLMELKATILEAHKDRIELAEEIVVTQRQIKRYKIIYLLSCILIVGIFIRTFKEKAEEAAIYLAELEQQLQHAFVDIDIRFDMPFEYKYEALSFSYQRLLTSHKIWDITSAVYQNRKATRSAASTVITRTAVQFSHDHVGMIRSRYSAFHLENKNGGDLYIYPAFVIMLNSRNEFALIDIKDFEMRFEASRFLEEERVPSDTEIIDHTWAKVNKNGQPDKRFKENYRIPIAKYGEIHISSESGLNESYSFSNFDYARQFVNAFSDYKAMV